MEKNLDTGKTGRDNNDTTCQHICRNVVVAIVVVVVPLFHAQQYASLRDSMRFHIIIIIVHFSVMFFLCRSDLSSVGARNLRIVEFEYAKPKNRFYLTFFSRSGNRFSCSFSVRLRCVPFIRFNFPPDDADDTKPFKLGHIHINVVFVRRYFFSSLPIEFQKKK